MPSYRGLRVNWKNPFKLCEDKTKFDQMEPTDKTFPTFAPSPTKHPDELTRQKQLHPQIKVVVPLVNPKKCSDFSAKYIRSHHNIQTAFETEYQLSQDDWKFLKNHQQQLKIDGQPIFDDHLLKQVIIFLEKKAKLGSQPKLKSKWLLPFIKKGPKEREKYININKIEQLLLSYWKRRRQAFIFPLYRPLWKNLNKQDLLFVYRPRGKKHVEKLTELDEESLTEQLCQQIEQTSMICQGFRARQLVKLKKIKKRIEQFEDWAKIYISQQELNNILGDGQLVAQRLTNVDQKAMNQTSQCVNKYFAKDRDIVSEQCTCQSYQSVPTSLAPQKLQKKKNILASIIPEISVENSSQQKSEDFWESIHGLRKEKAQAKQSQNVSAHEASQ